MLTIGYIGNGKSTNRYHLPFVIQRENIKVKTIYQRNPEHEVWDRIEGANYTSNLDEVLTDNDIDLIVVCTRHDSHYEYAKMVLKHNKHCLVEKPFMETSKQAREIFDLAKEKGLIVQAYQNRRFDSDFLTVQKVIEEGRLGDLIELEMHFDYYRPEVPETIKKFNSLNSYLYGHACHTIDQVISYFGKPDNIHYDVRQLLGVGRMNDYFDIDLYYGTLKVSVKSSYFRIKERPSFVLYGKKGCFIKETKDRQEEHLKLFYMPSNKDFGVDNLEHYGTLTYIDGEGTMHEEKVKSVNGDYGRVYDDLYETIVNGKSKTITDEQIMLQMQILETGIKNLI
ncbi:Predicted dehydrogenase [Clostridium cavendishii DSM 21758]|uniref:Predicted dehydrogenase n=1 Tax=Clostridium cavendishii DSM 21758 TaxID=1121302 RepID=A0A1M6NGL9_9CLOT|nr:Gfo/Idh/MocA family oxidoreductase [Clostridium cavendishii]SHJ94807.1 Predicted dehydrogenase [Clostridium cavendishii DSM 21758]